jgi:hypothetical protein
MEASQRKLGGLIMSIILMCKIVNVLLINIDY